MGDAELRGKGWLHRSLPHFSCTCLMGSCRFHCPAHEWTLEADVQLPVHEGVQLTAAEYRSRLYQVLQTATRIISHPLPPPGVPLPKSCSQYSHAQASPP